MAVILNLAILDSAILVFFSSQTHSHLPRLVPTICTKKNFTHSFWLNLMMAGILNSAILNLAILDSAILHKTLTQTSSIWLKLIHSDSTWWWQPSWALPSWIHPFCTMILHSFILTQLDDGSHLGFSHLRFSFETHSHLPRLVPTICTKKTSLIHSDSYWWWQSSWIWPSLIHPF